MMKITKKRPVEVDTPKVEVQTTLRKGKTNTVVTNEKDETLRVTPKPDIFEPSVGLSIGVTKDMGNYESFKVSAWGTTAILTGETYERAFERLSQILEARIDTEVEKWT